jgi:hypothetical protein
MELYSSPIYRESVSINYRPSGETLFNVVLHVECVVPYFLSFIYSGIRRTP